MSSVTIIIPANPPRAPGHVEPTWRERQVDEDLCYDTLDHQGSGPSPSRRDDSPEDEDEEESAPWMPERQPPRPAPFLRERRDNEFGGRLAKRPQLHDARETATVGGDTADPAQGHTAFLTVTPGGRVRLVAPTNARAEVPEPAWQVENIDAAGTHLLREVEPEPLDTVGPPTTGLTLVVTALGSETTVPLSGPAALPEGMAGLDVSGNGKTDVFSAIWHPTKNRYLIIPGPMGYEI